VFGLDTGQSFQLLGIPSALHRDLYSSAFNLTQIVGCQFEGNSSNVLLKARELRCAGNGNNPRLLGKQSGEHKPRWSSLFPLCKLAK
jgi:hypothetical protein